MPVPNNAHFRLFCMWVGGCCGPRFVNVRTTVTVGLEWSKLVYWSIFKSSARLKVLNANIPTLTDFKEGRILWYMFRDFKRNWIVLRGFNKKSFFWTWSSSKTWLISSLQSQNLNSLTSSKWPTQYNEVHARVTTVRCPKRPHWYKRSTSGSQRPANTSWD